MVGKTELRYEFFTDRMSQLRFEVFRSYISLKAKRQS